MPIKQRKRKPINPDELRCSMATAFRELESIYLNTDVDPEIRIKAMNSLATLANSYTRLCKETEAQETGINPNNPFLKKLNPVLAGQKKPELKSHNG